MAQKSYKISHPEYMHVYKDGEALYGCDQDWYRIEWRRRAGCGPVAATNILMFLRKRYDVARIPYNNDSIENAVAAMNDVFVYVRPKRRGLHTVKKFVRGMCKFGRSYGLRFWYQYIVVPPQASKRPDICEVAKFIEDGLKNDVPIAFLNLDAGEVEEQLSSWHWVTVVGMTFRDCAEAGAGIVVGADAEAGAEADVGSDADGRTQLAEADADADTDGKKMAANSAEYTLRYYDQAKCLEVDLGKWLGTTAWGGGFAYFCNPSPRKNHP